MLKKYLFHKNAWYRVTLIVTMLALVLSGQSPLTQTALAQSAGAPLTAGTNTLNLSVISARSEPRAFGGAGVLKGAAITNFKYIINIDNTGTTEQRSPADGCAPSSPGYPDSCNWVSVAGVKNGSYSPIYAQGNQDDFNGVNSNGLDGMPDGRYLISVIADGYKLDGAHFTVPFTTDPVVVELQPTPLPDATIRARVFEDNAPTNSAPDEPAEHGLAGFVGHITDYIGEVTTDVYGNPLCTVYVGEDPVTHIIPNSALDADMLPVVAVPGGHCVSDANGDLVMPHLGTNRYALSAVPPDGSNWVQTTTLEGNHDWDAWVMEGSTGFDTEFVVAGEPYPAIFFGFVHSTNTMAAGSGEIKGFAMAVKAYIPPTGGITGETGILGGRIDHPIDQPWVSLSDLNNGDQTVYVGRGNADGSFDIKNVPDGDYVLGAWDEPQDYIFNVQNVSVKNGEVIDMGSLSMLGWWTTIDGYVFSDTNGNGKRDPGEAGVPNFPIAMKKRENSMMDRGTVLVKTDQTGHYFMESAYPITQWLVEEAYSNQFKTTGVTYQADNQPTETTVLGNGVDVNVLPIIGLGGRLDWGVKAYDPGTNGGIVGTVSYDTTRNELDPRYAVSEDWQPGIPNMNVDLYAPVDCGTNAGIACDASGRYELAADGSFAKGQWLNQYNTETWERPSGCVARNVSNAPLVHGVDENVLPLAADAPCLEGPMMGVQFGPMSDGTNFGASVDGNYGFGDGCFAPNIFDAGVGTCTDPNNLANTNAFAPLTPADYLVKVEIPNDALGRPLYQVTKEEDINIFHGDQFIPQIPPSECAGPLRTVDLAGFGADNYAENTSAIPGVTIPASTPVDNPDFVGGGGTPYEGSIKPLCDTKLVTVSDRRSIAPNFNLFTDVPVPVRFWGLLVDDLNFSSNPQSLAYGEKMGIPFAPVGIYDYTNRLVDTVESDYNGLWDVLLPSTNRISCPTPSGVCASLYRFVGNDPGTPGHWNPNYNPQYRSIAAEFEAFPGLLVPADLAPTQVAVGVQIPGTQTLTPIACTVDTSTPQLFAVDKPYVNMAAGSQSFTISGLGFGAATGQVLLDNVSLPTSAWSDRQIIVNVPVGTAIGPHQLSIKSTNGRSTVNGLTFHVLGMDNPAFPSTAVLDTFNRSNGGLGSNWSGGLSNFSILSNQARAFASSRVWWNPASFGADQEAYFTFTKLSTGASEQSLFMKFTGNDPASSNSSLLQVTYASGAVRVRTKNFGQSPSNSVTRATFPVVFGVGDQLGARASADGTVRVYKNGAQVGQVALPTSGSSSWTTGGGSIGVRFNGVSNSDDARFDNFGGGDVVGSSYQPNVYEVGPGKTYATIQSAVDDATASAGDDLVVVYPGAVDATNPRYNGRGAYYENLIITSPIKLQGVGPGGVYADGTPVQGSIIDGIAFGGDTTLADAWRTKIAGLTWDGNQNVYDGEVIYILAHDGVFGSAYKAAIDGFDLRGGDQIGFPGNLNAIFGGYPGPIGAVAVETQGGAIYANAFVRNLQITNNTVQNNGGAYGTIRLGTPNLAAPDTNQHNENVRIANNRIIANGGTNLAGAIGLFNGSDNYEVASNDICGNFSAEYGGGISAFGYSPNGKIHDNRIYFNRSYDEGAGIMIAGELPLDPNANYGSPTGPQGSGAVDIYNNLLQANLSDDDGGGLRFLMAGNFPMNVYNNMIVNNVSTHEGGGVAIDDAPNVRFYNNTVMKNTTTATSVTSNGLPAPAGISTSLNSQQLQGTLPLGSPAFGSPLLFNNIFWDNRAGTKGINGVLGIGSAGDATPINNWDLGTADASGLLAPTNSVLQVTTGTTASPTNVVGTDPNTVSTYDIPLFFTSWRTNVNLTGAIMVSADLPPTLMGNYHITNSSTAFDKGASSKSGTNAPAFDIDRDSRPAFAAFDIGADEVPATADLSITKTDGQTIVTRGGSVTYSIVVSDIGPGSVIGATVTDIFPANLTGATWTCSASGGATCPVSGTGNINATVNLPVGGIATFSANATVSATAAGSITNTATVAAPAGTTDPNTANNTASDTDTLPTADLSIAKSHTPANVYAGNPVIYTIGVTNNGPDAVSGASVVDNLPASLSGVSWLCSPVANCAAASGSGNINTTVNLAANATATIIVHANVSATATGTLTNTATVTAPASVVDPNTGNNSATDSSPILPSVHIGNLDAVFSNLNAGSWQATVTATVHDAAHNPVRFAVVSGNWSSGSSGTVACITNSAGQCSISRAGFSKSTVTNVTFTVSSVLSLSGAYLPSANHDPDGSSNGTAITITLPTMHVGDLDQTANNTSGSQWQAQVTITVHNATEGLLSGALVNVTWVGGGAGVTSCTTNGAGQCTITRTNLSRSSAASATLTVNSVTHATQAITYLASANHDPDSGAQASNGTNITVSRP